jgi:hypothetical protein
MVRWDRSRRSLLYLGAVLVLAALWPALAAGDAGALRGALTVGWVGLLLMIASLWQPAALRRHEGWVDDVRPPMDDAAAFRPYAVAGCSCGWRGTGRATVEEAFAEARTHTEQVDAGVRRPLG